MSVCPSVCSGSHRYIDLSWRWRHLPCLPGISHRYHCGITCTVCTTSVCVCGAVHLFIAHVHVEINVDVNVLHIRLADITPRIYPSTGQNPPVSGKAGQNPKGIIPCRIKTQCTMSFSVSGEGVLKAKFQD